MIAELFRWTLPNVLFAVLTVAWWMEFRLYPSRRHADASHDQSFRWILAAVAGSIAFSIVIRWLEWGVLGGPGGTFLQIGGLAVYAGGLGLRYWSLRHLDRYFSRDLRVSASQDLVSDGPYRLLRHPMYLGLLLLTVGVPMFLRVPGAAGLTMAVMGLVLNRRMAVEESLMEEVMGSRYAAWRDARRRFVPGVF